MPEPLHSVGSRAAKAIKGEHLPQVTDPGLDWYGKSNIDDPTIKAVL